MTTDHTHHHTQRMSMTPDQAIVFDLAMEGMISMSKAIGWATEMGWHDLAERLRAS